MSNLIFRLRYFAANWKLIVHLLFWTKYFGVNNRWRSDFPSMFGWPWYKILWSIVTVRPIIDNYRCMKIRARMGFVSKDTYDKLFGARK